MSSDSPESNNSKNKSQAYLKYTGMAFQMAAILVGAVLLGQWLDKKVGTDTPYFTAGLSLFFLIAYFVKLYYDLIKK